MIVPAQQKQQSSLFLPTGPPHVRRRDTLADLPVGTVLRVKTTAGNQPFLRLEAVSKTAPRPQDFPQVRSTSSRRKGSIKPDLLSLSLGYYLPSKLCDRVNAVPTSGLIRPCRDPCLRSKPRSAFIPPHHQPTLRRRYPPGPSIQADPVAAPPHASLRASLLLAGASDESVADIGFLLPIPPPWPQVLFSCRQLVIVPVTSRRQGDTTNNHALPASSLTDTSHSVRRNIPLSPH